MTIGKISWVFYIVGTVLVVGSWVNLVSPEVGWLGWIVAMLGWGAQFLPGQRRQSTADEIEKLDRLRASGAITDAEFETQKERLLAG